MLIHCVRKYRVQLSQPLRQRSRTRLQDKGRLHFVDVFVMDGADVVPTFALANPFLLHGATTPGTNNDFGIAAYHVGRSGAIVWPDLRPRTSASRAVQFRGPGRESARDPVFD